MILVSGGLLGCGKSDPLPPTALDISAPSVYTTLLQEERFQSFVSMIEKADLEKWLHEEKNITVFAPTNEAIQPLLQDRAIMSQIISDPDYIVQGVRKHILPRKLSLKQLQNLESVFDINEQEITLIPGEESIMLNGQIQILPPAIEAGNGIIYPVDATLMGRE